LLASRDDDPNDVGLLPSDDPSDIIVRRSIARAGATRRRSLSVRSRVVAGLGPTASTADRRPTRGKMRDRAKFFPRGPRALSSAGTMRDGPSLRDAAGESRERKTREIPRKDDITKVKSIEARKIFYCYSKWQTKLDTESE
jgi:hypothetical protein